MLERLQKIIARAGVTSRRKAEDLIVSGRVTVDGTVVRELGAKADQESMEVRVDGVLLRSEKKVYVALNKPPGVICSNLDELARVTAVDLVGARQRLFCVGRLDEHSEGLLLLTNDGEFAQRLAHPRHGVRKTYLARVEGDLSEPDLEKIRKGIWLAEGRTREAEVALKKRAHGASLALITLREGKNREVRRIFARLGHKVFTLRRVRIGPIALGAMRPGEWRRLTASEVRALVDESSGGGPKARRGPRAHRAPARAGARVRGRR